MIFLYFLAASAAKNCTKEAVIQSAASAASTKGGCASSRLDHGLKFYVIQGLREAALAADLLANSRTAFCSVVQLLQHHCTKAATGT